MTNGKENSRNFQISGKKDNRLSIYLILCRKFRLNSPVVTHEEAPGTNLFACACWPLFPPCQGISVIQRAVRTFNVSMAFWPRIFRNLRSLLLIIASKTLCSLSVPIPGKEKFMLAYVVQDIVQETKHKQNKHELTRQDSLPSFSSLSVHLATLPIQSTDF